MNEKKIIPVVFATDEYYVPYCGTAIKSLIDHTTQENEYYIYIMYNILSESAIYRFRIFEKNNVHICFLCIHDEISKLNVYEHNHLSIATTYRLLIPKMLPEYDKVIYLDSDIVVVDDIAKMYDIELADNYLGAVNGFFDTAFFKDYTKNVLKIDHSHFFNAGVLLMNLKQFRENNIGEQCLDLLTHRTDLIYMDQCALNIICEGKVTYLPRKWNFEWNFLFEQNIDKDKFICEEYSILHFDGFRKPWDYITQIYSEQFWLYARKTVFYEEIVRRGNSKRSNELIAFFNGGKIIKKAAVYGAGFRGKQLVEKLLNLDVIQVVAWVDKNYKNISSGLMEVSEVDKLLYSEYDIIYVAIERQDIFLEVQNELSEKRIAKEKICQMVI